MTYDDIVLLLQGLLTNGGDSERWDLQLLCRQPMLLYSEYIQYTLLYIHTPLYTYTQKHSLSS